MADEYDIGTDFGGNDFDNEVATWNLPYEPSQLGSVFGIDDDWTAGGDGWLGGEDATIQRLVDNWQNIPYTGQFSQANEPSTEVANIGSTIGKIISAMGLGGIAKLFGLGGDGTTGGGLVDSLLAALGMGGDPRTAALASLAAALGLGKLSEKGKDVGGPRQEISVLPDETIQAMMKSISPMMLSQLAGINTDLANVTASGAMTPESVALLRQAANQSRNDTVINQLTGGISGYLTQGGGITPQEQEAESAYRAAMTPALLEQVKNIVRQMGGVAYSSGPMAQLMQDAIVKAQLESTANYANFMTGLGGNLASRNQAKASLYPTLAGTYTSNLSPLAQAAKTVAALEAPNEQTRAIQASLRGQAGNAAQPIYTKVQPTQYVYPEYHANQTTLSRILEQMASSVAGGNYQPLTGRNANNTTA